MHSLVGNLVGKTSQDRAILISHVVAVQTPQVELLQLVINVPYSNHSFFGREKELGELHRNLHADAETSRHVVIWGLGGQGKSRLVQQYLHLHQSEYHLIIWINAMTLASAQESFAQAAWEMKMRNPSWAGATTAISEANVKLVLRWLSNFRKKRWLLVVDSLDDLESYDPRDILPTCTHGNVIVTSTNSRTPEILRYDGLELGGVLSNDGSEMLLSGLEVEESQYHSKWFPM